MPSMGMGKTTRVFRARVLRSGRQMWIPCEGKRVRAIEGEQWIELLDRGDAAQCKENGWHRNSASLKQESTGIIVNTTTVAPQLDRPESENKNVDKMWGIVYTRKRKRAEFKNLGIADKGVNWCLEHGRFGRQYVRKRCKKKIKGSSAESSQGHTASLKHIVIVNSSHASTNLISCLLNSILCYMRTTSVSLHHLYGFLNTKPIHDLYSLHGIRFLEECPSEMKLRACIISGVWFSLPVFSVNFSTVPCCFMYIHSSLFLRPASSSYILWTFSMASNEGDVKMAVDTEHLLCECDVSESDHLGQKGVPSDIDSRMWVLAQPVVRVPKVTVGNFPCDTSESDHLVQKGVPSNIDSGMWVLAQPAPRVPKVTVCNLPSRNGCTIQKRRSTFRSRRGRCPSVLGMQKDSRVLISNNFMFRHNGILSSTLSSCYGPRSSAKKIPIAYTRELISASVVAGQNIDARSCSANLLVIESDKCYREEAAIITLERSVSKHWILVVKRGGMERFQLTAERVMRPCVSNRVTHAIIWNTNDNWRMEFLDRKDWLIFKELYKECYDRNTQPQAVSSIPIPGISEVSGYTDSNYVPFIQPDSYISVKDDEPTRALASRTAIYDLDSDDEEWLNKFNNQSCSENKLHEHISGERLELMIDAFERGAFSNPDGFADEKAACSICLDLERKEVVEAVYNYWSKKRKQKRSTLMRIFQLYQPRTQEIPKSVIRKKKLFKRQKSQAGRGKQLTFLKAVEDAQQQQSAMVKIKEAEAAAHKQECVAVVKRQKAQQLMESADLLTFKAMMALRIAEAAKTAESADGAASFFHA
nr:uncharacterized protein LOC109187862 [Ipomoea batatas]